MKKYSVRPAKPEDAKNYGEWLVRNPAANLDVVTYPTANTVVVEADGEPVQMNTFHLVIMQEAVASKPELLNVEGVQSLAALHEGVKAIARASGVKEIWFACSDPKVEKLALKQGFKKVSFPVLMYQLEK